MAILPWYFVVISNRTCFACCPWLFVAHTRGGRGLCVSWPWNVQKKSHEMYKKSPIPKRNLLTALHGTSIYYRRSYIPGKHFVTIFQQFLFSSFLTFQSFWNKTQKRTFRKCLRYMEKWTRNYCQILKQCNVVCFQLENHF